MKRSSLPFEYFKIIPVVLIIQLFFSCEYESIHRNIALSFEAKNEEYIVDFTSEANYEGDYFWDFGDGNTSELANPKHNYVASGEYEVSLTFSIKDDSTTTTKPIIVKGIDLEDIDGNSYRTTQFVGRIWMAENLRTSRCQDGTPIEVLALGSGDTARKGMFWHDDTPDSPNSLLHGPVYNRNTVLDCNICPEGWHIPSQNEWNTLIQNWQEEHPGAAGLTYAAYQMRVRGDQYWNNNDKATNSSGFSALPGGWLDSKNTTYSFFGNRVGYWRQDNRSLAALKIASGEDGTWLGGILVEECFYVRCIKDLE
ncbi:MAG: FISUMP domain-containing protein [Bacteroidota bacterium]